MKESKLSPNCEIDTKKQTHIMNRYKGIPTLVKRDAPVHQ